MRDVIFLFLIIVLAVVALRRPVWGIYIFISLGIINLQSYTWGFGRNLPFALIIAICTFGGFVFSKYKGKIPQQREFWAMLGLWGLFGLTTMAAYGPGVSESSDETLAHFIHVSKILLMVLFSMIVIQTTDQIHILLKVIALSIGFYAIKGGLFSIFTGFSNIFWGPENSFLYANNAIGLALAINIPFLFYLIKIESHKWIRILMWMMLVLSFPAIIGTFSRGAWLGMFAATALIFLRSKYKALILITGTIIISMGLPILSMDVLPERVAQRFDQLVNYEEDGSAQSRFWNWETCRRVGVNNPILGKGFNFYSLNMYLEYYPEFIEKYGYNKVWTCHSMWLTVFAEHGIPTFLLWVSILGMTFLSLRRISLVDIQSPEQYLYPYFSRMLKIGLIVYMVVGTFLDTAYFDLYYQMIGVVVILKECQKVFLSNMLVSRPKEAVSRSVE